jgi:hypothetical protein
MACNGFSEEDMRYLARLAEQARLDAEVKDAAQAAGVVPATVEEPARISR